MPELSFYGWVVEFDADMNRHFDRKAAGFGSESCDCVPCRNFLAQWNDVYPPDVVDFLNTIGSPPFEVEVLHFGPEGDKQGDKHLYQAWIPFIGTLRRGDRRAPWPPRLVSDVGFGPFQLNVPALVGPSVMQLEYSVGLPWVLEDEPCP
jgi:hypothetical protein